MSKYAEPFTKVAADIDRNPEDSFGGAYCIKIPPDSLFPEGLEISGLYLGKPNATDLLTILQARMKDEMDQMMKMSQGGFQVRR